MYILAIETTGAYASVALLQADEAAERSQEPVTDGRILGVIHGNDRFSHLQNLTPQIQQILGENAVSINDIMAIAVSHGPGSFTGIRIGVSTARALAQILQIPCLAVSSLEALALRAADEGVLQTAEEAAAAGTTEGAQERQLICPVLDARRKQVYGAAYEIADGQPVCRIQPSSCLMTEFLQKLDHLLAGEGCDRTDEECDRTGAPAPRVTFIGDGIDTCGEIIQQWMQETGNDRIRFIPKERRYQDAQTVALRGLQLYRAGQTCNYMDLQPEYLRMAEAEKKLRDRQAAEVEKTAEAAQNVQAAETAQNAKTVRPNQAAQAERERRGSASEEKIWQK